MKSHALSVKFLLAASLACMSPALAQDAMLGGAPLTASAPVAAPTPTFSDAEFAGIAKMLEGSWTSSSPVQGAGGSYSVVFSTAPVAITGMTDTIYCESARSEAVDAPYRQTVMQFYRAGDKVRLRTMEFRRPNGEMIVLRGLWAAPETFPAQIGAKDLVTTMELEFTKSGNTYTGKSVHGYPTTAGNAIEMTSEMVLSPGVLKLADRGHDASGAVVWGPAAGQYTEMSHQGGGVQVARMEGGLVVLTFPSNVDQSHVPHDNNKIKVHYLGCTGDGNVFDTSYERNTPFEYAYDTQLIAGWNRGMADVRKGMKRKLIVPGALAYGERGSPRAKIGPNATLYFQIECLDILEQAPPPPVQPVEAQPEMKKEEIKSH